MIPLGNAVRIEGYGAHTGRNGSAGLAERKIQFPMPQAPKPIPKKTPKKTPTQRTCPSCGGHNIHRSRRRLMERLTTWLHPDQRMFRCYRCQHRFWDLYKIEDDPDLAPMVPPLTVLRNHTRVASQTSIANGGFEDPEQEVPFLLRVDYWLYRKHSVTLGALIILMLTSGLMFSGLFWALGSFSRY